jgi:hypothetical protein
VLALDVFDFRRREPRLCVGTARVAVLALMPQRSKQSLDMPAAAPARRIADRACMVDRVARRFEG